jgi:hypothetical protein
MTAAAGAHNQQLVGYEAASVKALVWFDAGEPGSRGVASPLGCTTAAGEVFVGRAKHGCVPNRPVSAVAVTARRLKGSRCHRYRSVLSGAV